MHTSRRPIFTGQIIPEGSQSYIKNSYCKEVLLYQNFQVSEPEMEWWKWSKCLFYCISSIMCDFDTCENLCIYIIDIKLDVSLMHNYKMWFHSFGIIKTPSSWVNKGNMFISGCTIPLKTTSYEQEKSVNNMVNAWQQIFSCDSGVLCSVPILQNNLALIFVGCLQRKLLRRAATVQDYRHISVGPWKDVESLCYLKTNN